jgi:hypothetical protein
MTGRWWSVGSVLAALSGATCCIGPLLFTALGLSSLVSLWILRHFVPYRNLFFAITVVCLGLGFYTAYRHGGQGRRRDKVIVWASTLLVLILVGYSLYVEGLVL